MVALASSATSDIADMVIWVAIIVGVVVWHWINRKYPSRWDR